MLPSIFTVSNSLNNDRKPGRKKAAFRQRSNSLCIGAVYALAAAGFASLACATMESILSCGMCRATCAQ